MNNNLIVIIAIVLILYVLSYNTKEHLDKRGIGGYLNLYDHERFDDVYNYSPINKIFKSNNKIKTNYATPINRIYKKYSENFIPSNDIPHINYVLDAYQKSDIKKNWWIVNPH
jgi:hypothetical protein